MRPGRTGRARNARHEAVGQDERIERHAVYVPIVRGPVQKAVWTFAKALAVELASRHPALMTSEYRVAKRPRGRVLVDYNQNRWGSTLASVYSVRPRPLANVSTPLTLAEVAGRAETEDFRIDNVPARVQVHGDLWKPLRAARGRADLEIFLQVKGRRSNRDDRRHAFATGLAGGSRIGIPRNHGRGGSPGSARLA